MVFLTTCSQLGDVAQEYLDGTRRLQLEMFNRNGRVRNKGGGRSVDDEASQAARSRRPPPSTNVSSPVHSVSKSRKAKSAIATFMDEEDEDVQVALPGTIHKNGYERDDFVVSDHEEDAFEPVHRPSRPPAQGRQQTLEELGPPISRDPRLSEAGLDDVHRDVVQAFVEKARELEENLRNKHGLRRTLFTEQQFREMAIRWTTSVAHIYTIRGVDKSKVDLYGAKFASLVQQFYTQYKEMMGKDTVAQSCSAAEMVSQYQKREVVDLISDDEGLPVNYAEEEDEEEDLFVGNDEDDEELEASRYFGESAAGLSSRADSVSSSVQQWNKKYDELAKAGKKNKSSSKSSSGKSASRGSGSSGSSGWNRGKSSYSSKKRGGPSRSGGSSTGAGVPKRKSWGGGSRKVGSGSGSGSGISTMPY